MIDAALMSQVKTLSVADRIELIETVWEMLSSSELPVSEQAMFAPIDLPEVAKRVLTPPT